MEFTAKQIAEFIQGSVEGNENASVHTFAKIEEGVPGAISFLSNPKYTHYLYDTQSSIVLVDRNLELEKETQATLIRVDNAYEAVAKLLALYEMSKPKKKGIDSLAYIAPTAQIDEDCYIAPFAYIGENVHIGKGTQIYPHTTVYDNASVGEDCVLYSNVSVYHDCKIGNRVILHAGCVIGADGFGFAPTENGYDKIPQIGIVLDQYCISGEINGKPTYDYTIPMLIFTGFGVLALVISLLLKREDRIKGYGLELPNIQKDADKVLAEEMSGEGQR